MEKKSSTVDVYQINKRKDYAEIYKHVTSKLGDDHPFAKFNIGAGFFVWKDSRQDWTQMIAVDEVHQKLVRQAFVEARQNVASKLGEKVAEMLFTIPDDSYIYFAQHQGRTKVLLAGWGFKKPVRTIGKPEDKKRVYASGLTISLIYDGEKLPNHRFILYLTEQEKEVATDANGIFSLPPMTVGEKLDFLEPASGKKLSLIVENDKKHYDFDVTRRCTLTVTASLDGRPLVCENATISYMGRDYALSTSPAGKATVEVVLYPGKPIEAKMRDQLLTQTLSEGDNQFDFVFTTPPYQTDVVVDVLENNMPLAGVTVDILYGGKPFAGRTDSDGKMRMHTEVLADETCRVSVEGYDNQSRPLAETPENVFTFERTIQLPPEEPEKELPEVEEEKEPDSPTDIKPEPPQPFEPEIFIEGRNGYIGTKYPITMEYNGVATKYTSDDEGIVALPPMLQGETIHVIDDLNPDNTADYILDADQKRYVFKVPYQPSSAPKEIKVMVRDINGKPIECDYVRFLQKGFHDIIAHFDNEGNVNFSRDSFKLDTPIEVTFTGAKRELPPITFKVTADENEYLLQEKNTKPIVVMVILQLLAVLASIGGALTLWMPLMHLFANVFDKTY